MNIYAYMDVDRGVLSPEYSESSYVSGTQLVTATQMKEHLGLYSGGGTPFENTSLDNVIKSLIAWATEKISEWEGQPIIPANVVDYYSSVGVGVQLELSYREHSSDDPKVEIISKGSSEFTEVNATQWHLDATQSPATIRLGFSQELSDQYRNPVRVSYTTAPYTRRRRDLLIGTIIRLVQYRQSDQGDNAGSNESAVRRIIVANLGT